MLEILTNPQAVTSLIGIIGAIMAGLKGLDIAKWWTGRRERRWRMKARKAVKHVYENSVRPWLDANEKEGLPRKLTPQQRRMAEDLAAKELREDAPKMPPDYAHEHVIDAFIFVKLGLEPLE